MKPDIASLKVGVIIESILDDFGIPHHHHRAACPIHGGDNRGAFVFNDETFYCHTKGCKGDIVTLIMALAETDIHGAIEYLARKHGITLGPSTGRTTEFTRSLPDQSDQFREERRKMAPEDFTKLLSMSDDLTQAKFDLAECRQNIARLTQELANLNQLKKRKKIARSLYYLNTQKIEDNRLAIYDEQEAALNYKIKQLKKAIHDQRKKVDGK